MVCGSVLRANQGRKRIVAWVEESRSTVLDSDQLDQVDLGLPLPDEACMAVAIEIRLRAKIDNNAVKTLTRLKEDCLQLKLGDA